MSDIVRHQTTPRYSEVVVHQGTAYLSGQVPEDASADIRGQMRQVLRCIDTLLESVGSDKSRLLSAQVFLRDLTDYSAMNELWDAWLPPGCAPARACIQAPLADPAWRVEILVTAAV
jgi:enamine deaminase RidA (YjgF/YER057c/UK114 family)